MGLTQFTFIISSSDIKYRLIFFVEGLVVENNDVVRIEKIPADFRDNKEVPQGFQRQLLSR